jgi:hypothetical protein
MKIPASQVTTHPLNETIYDLSNIDDLVTSITFSFTGNASQKAVTDEGEVVLLNPNGTWLYESERSEKSDISVNKTAFIKPKFEYCC